MARRKVTPNLPADTLARARAQAGLPAEDSTTAVNVLEATLAEPGRDEAIVTESSVVMSSPRTNTSKRLQAAQLERTKKRGELDQDAIKDFLMNPTRFPTAADLRHDYTFVVKDLRNMFLLSMGLVAFLIMLAVALP